MDLPVFEHDVLMFYRAALGMLVQLSSVKEYQWNVSLGGPPVGIGIATTW